MRHKITDEQYEYFVLKSKEWIDRFSLHELDFHFVQDGASKNCRASFTSNYDGRKVVLALGKYWNTPATDKELEYSAFHEVCHAMFIATNVQTEILFRADHEAREHETINKLWHAFRMWGSS